MTIPLFCFSRLLHVQRGCEHGHPGAVLRHLLPRPLLRLCRGIGEGVLRAEHPRAVGGPGLSTICQQPVNILSTSVSICCHPAVSLSSDICLIFSSIVFNQFSMHAFSVFSFSQSLWTVTVMLSLNF